MDVEECLKNRRTVRKFKNLEVNEDVLEKILDAARWAPSSRNQQPWHLITLRNKTTLTLIGETASSGSFIAHAPLAIAIVMKDADQPLMDAGRMLQQMELMAWSLGLGTCYVTFSPSERETISEILKVPGNADLITVLPFGYRMDNLERKGVPRKKVSEIRLEEFFTLED